MATGSTDEVEEERRLLYVAMTRARDHLQIVVPQRFFVAQQAQFGDRHVYAGRTRFIPASLLHLFDTRSWPAVEPSAAQAVVGVQDTVMDMRARIREMLLAK
jgi:DNA helicase-2/ATP-dependent DNA helicase PcrA